MTSDARILRALRYPYDVPAGSFLFDSIDGEIATLGEGDVVGLSAGRHPVLAIGSNASPQQLARKFAAFDEDPLIPVVEVQLSDYDVVFAARVASYGAVPATVTSSPLTVVAVKLLMLTDSQLGRMNKTESLGTAYDLEPIDPSLVVSDSKAWTHVLEGCDQVWCYVARAGPLLLDEAPAALDAVQAVGRLWSAFTEAEVLTRVAAAFCRDLHDFIRNVVDDDAYRSSVNQVLMKERTV